MAIVVQYQPDQIQDTPVARPQMSGADPVAAAGEKLGGAISNTGNQLSDLAIQAQERLNLQAKIQANTAITSFANDESTLQTAKLQKAAMASAGKPAVYDPNGVLISPEVPAQADVAVAGLTNYRKSTSDYIAAQDWTPLQKRNAQNIADEKANQLDLELNRHLKTQSHAYFVTTATSGIKSAMNDMALHYQDPGAVEVAAGTMEQTVRDLAQIQGWSPATQQQALEDYRSAGYTDVIMKMADDPNFGAAAAKEYYDKIQDVKNGTNAKRLITDANKVQSIDRYLHPLVQGQEAMDAAESAFASTHPDDKGEYYEHADARQQMIDDLRERNKPATVINAATQHFDARIAQEHADRHDAAGQAMSPVLDKYNDWQIAHPGQRLDPATLQSWQEYRNVLKIDTPEAQALAEQFNNMVDTKHTAMVRELRAEHRANVADARSAAYQSAGLRLAIHQAQQSASQQAYMNATSDVDALAQKTPDEAKMIAAGMLPADQKIFWKQYQKVTDVTTLGQVKIDNNVFASVTSGMNLSKAELASYKGKADAMLADIQVEGKHKLGTSQMRTVLAALMSDVKVNSRWQVNVPLLGSFNGVQTSATKRRIDVDNPNSILGQDPLAQLVHSGGPVTTLNSDQTVANQLVSKYHGDVNAARAAYKRGERN